MRLVISASPHQRAKLNTPYIMRQVIFALIPAVIAAVVFFKQAAVFLILNCALTAVVTEEIILKIRKKPSQAKDLSALLSGILLALVLPPTIKWWAASLGAVFAIAVGKHLFGGLGQNIFNPALIARAFLMAAYPKMLTSWVKPFSLDAVTSATPLALRKFSHTIMPLKDLFWGNVSGSLGETSAICLIIGGIYLLLRKIADWRIPVSLLASLSIFSLILFWVNPQNGSVLFHLFAGGVLLGAFFMATDPVTTPVTKLGRWIFGAGCGIIIMVIRIYSGLPEGVMYSIIFMNALTPLINIYTKPKSFGR